MAEGAATRRPPSTRAPVGERSVLGWLLQHRRHWKAAGAAACWYALAVALLTPAASFRRPTYRVGDLMPRDVVATRPVEVIDHVAYQNRYQRLVANRVHVWVRDGSVWSRARARLDAFFDLLETRTPQNDAQMRELRAALRDQIDLELSETAISAFLPARLRGLQPPLSLREVREALRRILDLVLDGRGVVYMGEVYAAQFQSGTLEVVDDYGRPMTAPAPDTLLIYPRGVEELIQRVELPRNFRGADHEPLQRGAAELLLKLIEPNVRPDPERTQERLARELAQLEADPPKQTFLPGTPIARRGEILTQVQVAALQRLAELESRLLAVRLVGILAVTAVFFAAIRQYLRRFRREVALTAATVTLHALPPIMGLAFGRALLAAGLAPSLVTIAFPSAMVGLLSAMMLSPQVAFVLVLTAVALFGVVFGMDYGFLIYGLFGGFAAVMACRLVRGRGQVLGVGVFVGLVNVGSLAILAALGRIELSWGLALLAALNGVACALATLMLLVIFERVFNIVTDLRLLELTGIKNKLITEFEEKAPGSYQHVLNVTKLAEAAAEAIGANYLLVRAGAYYHDIGKMIKPKYFSENQVTLEDKKAHARLSPYMSVLIIKNHVKEGIELARKAGLPEKVIEFIPQHHGTGLIRYFYAEALRRYEESETPEPVNEEDFRYPGPKPQSIETAIVLLADSVEAVAASKFTGGQVSENELRMVVHQTINEKFADGQFDECDLTMNHLSRIREAFVRALLARYHFRVAYPVLQRREPTPATGTAA